MNNTLRSEIELSRNQEIKEQLRLDNTTLMNTIDQCFSALETVMIYTVHDLVHSLVVSTNQNNTHNLHQIHPSLTMNQPPTQSTINSVIFIHQPLFLHIPTYSITIPLSTRNSSIDLNS